MKKIIYFCLFGFILSCQNSAEEESKDYSSLPYSGTKTAVNELIVHELSDPDKLNPICSQGAGSTYIEHCIFMYLLDVDKEKLEVIPWLAKERPTITTLEEGGPYKLKIDYEIRAEAKWDNGSDVTGYDVAFTYKAVKNPLVDAEHQRPYIDFITHIEIDQSNPKKFSFYTKELNYAAEFSSGGVLYILPEYIYDPKGLMKDYSLKELSDDEAVLKFRNETKFIQFAEDFNSEKFQREVGFVEGCGPYSFESWETGQRIILKKKKNWWGNALSGVKSFENYPEKIIYEIINDQITAITAMKDEQIDLMRSVPPFDFSNLKDEEQFNSKYFVMNPKFLSYTYIGLNMRNDILKDKLVRKALASCVNVPQIIDILYYGYAQPIASFVHPSKPYYNKLIAPYELNLELARELLNQAGWEDLNNDGILEKEINGKIVPLKLSMKYNSGNDVREKICIFLKENAKKVGIEIEIEAREWSVYLDECTNHDFDMYVLGWVQEAVLDDPKQLFHTEAYNGGSNYPGFGNAYTDNLIDELRQEMDDDKRGLMMAELQAIVHDEVPYIFLFTPDNLLCINKRFGNARAYLARPGYEERELILGAYKGVQE